MNIHAAAIALSGRPNGHGWLCRCPVKSHGRGRGDLTPSLSLSDGEGGKLLIHCFAGCHPRDVLQELSFRGLLDPTPANASTTMEAAKVAKIAKPPAAYMNRTAISEAKRLWQTCSPAADSLVETYLASRSIILPSPASLRFHPRLWHSKAKTFFPAMVASVYGPDGCLNGVHRTYLCSDGSAKAPIKPAKMMLGKCSGGAVRLIEAGKTLQVAEGIETALAVLQATKQPTWAALSTSGLRALILPSNVIRVTVLADGDDAGETTAEAAAERWSREGREVHIARAPRGFDFADVLVGKSSVSIEGIDK